jgi:hypothetical protein
MSILDDIDIQVNDDTIIISSIMKFIKDNYVVYDDEWHRPIPASTRTINISNKPSSDGKYQVSSNYSVDVSNLNMSSLTNGMFVWNTIRGDFNCGCCKNLTSLDGAPKKVNGYFSCYNCGKEFTKDDVQQICDVSKNKIHVKLFSPYDYY